MSNAATNGTKSGCLKSTFALLAAALIGATVYYFVALRHEPTAWRHVPAGSNIVMRVNGFKIATFKPVRTHIWPLLFADGRKADKKTKNRIERIKSETGVDIPHDLRELVVASVDGLGWVAIVGGKFDNGFTAGLHRALKQEGIESWKEQDPMLIHPSGWAIAQADDGTLIAGTSRQVVQAALPASNDPAAMPLPVDEALSFYFTRAAYSGLLDLWPSALPGMDTLRQIDHVSGSLRLSEEPELVLHATPQKGVTATTLSADMRGVLGKMRLAALFLPGKYWGAKTALSNATVDVRDDSVWLVAPWPYEPLDTAVQHLARSLAVAKAFDQ